VDWLNFHHLRYFYVAAKEGGLAKAAEKLRVSQPSISAQLRELEEALGVALFRRSGRSKTLTDAGQVAFAYAGEIFSLGQEMINSLRNEDATRALRLSVGVADSFPKLLTNTILAPVFAMKRPVNVVCREGKIEDLLAQLAAHRLDVVLSDEPAPGSIKVRTFTHPLGECGVSFCAAGALAGMLKKGFPRSLNGAPALLPADNTGLRRSLEQWFRDIRVRPNIMAEFEDSAMMKVMAADGKGFTVLPSQCVDEAVQRYDFKIIGSTRRCLVRFYAITGERRLHHPGVMKITEQAQAPMQGRM
jgi:LysR family transcriptional activator of nhaA